MFGVLFDYISGSLRIIDVNDKASRAKECKL